MALTVDVEAEINLFVFIVTARNKCLGMKLQSCHLKSRLPILSTIDFYDSNKMLIHALNNRTWEQIGPSSVEDSPAITTVARFYVRTSGDIETKKGDENKSRLHIINMSSVTIPSNAIHT